MENFLRNTNHVKEKEENVPYAKDIFSMKIPVTFVESKLNLSPKFYIFDFIILYDEFFFNIDQKIGGNKLDVRIPEFIMKFIPHTRNFIFADNRERTGKNAQYILEMYGKDFGDKN